MFRYKREIYFVKPENIFIISYSFDVVQRSLQQIFVTKRHESSSVYIQVFSTQYLSSLSFSRSSSTTKWLEMLHLSLGISTPVCKGIDAALTKLGLDWLTILVVMNAKKKKFFGLTMKSIASFKLS